MLMHILYAAVLSALLSAKLTESKNPWDSPFSCTRRLDGVYSIDEDCHQYVVCESFKMSIHNCPSGLAFSSTVYACLPEEEVGCKSQASQVESFFEDLEDLENLDKYYDVLCANHPNEILGYFSDKRQQCRHFYRCENGYRNDFQCPINMVFNEKIGACLPSKLYSCPTIQQRDVAARKVARQIKFFRFHDQKRNALSSEAEELADGGQDHLDSVRQTKFASAKSVEERQVKFKRVNQLLQQLSDLVKNE